MAAHWSIKNYNAFVRDLRASTGLSLKDARNTYRSMSERLGRPVFAKDIERHPRITKQEATKAERAGRRAERAERKQKTERAERSEPKRKTLNSIAAYMDAFEDSDDWVEVEYESTAEY